MIQSELPKKSKNTNICKCGINEKVEAESYCKECLKENPLLCN